MIAGIAFGNPEMLQRNAKINLGIHHTHLFKSVI